MTSSVGAPQFDFEDIAIPHGLAPEFGGDERPPPPRKVWPVALGALAFVVLLMVFAGSTRDEPAGGRDPLADASASTLPGSLGLDPLFLEQNGLEHIGYSAREIDEDSIFVATETPDGYFGLRRGDDGWVTATSVDGIDWTIRTTEIVGIPEGFRPGARRWGPDPLQYVDGVYWGRFVSRRLAGSSGAMLILKSADGVRWEGIDGVPVGLDQNWFADTLFGRPDDFEVRGADVYALNPINEPLVFSIPDVHSDSWEIVDVAAGSGGGALLFHNRENLSFRLAVSRNGAEWSTVGIGERGEAAIEIVVVGTDAVLLRAADVENGPLELIVPFPEESGGSAGSNDVTEAEPPAAAVRAATGIDFLPTHVAAVGNIFVGLLPGQNPSDPPAFVSSLDGVAWDRTDAPSTTGLPPGSVPVDLWANAQPGLFGAFTNADDSQLFFARSLGGREWTIGPTFEPGDRGELLVVSPTRNGAFFSIDDGRGTPTSIAHHGWNMSTNELATFEFAPNDVVTAASDSPLGLVVAVLSLSDPSAGTQFRLFDHSGEWTVLDGESDLLFVAEIVTSRFPRVIAFSARGVHETDWERLLDGNGDVDWQLVSQIGPEATGTFGLRDLEIGQRGAAALVTPIDNPRRVSVLVTRDYENWTSIDLALTDREAATARIVGVTRNTAVIGGTSEFSRFALIAPLDGLE